MAGLLRPPQELTRAGGRVPQHAGSCSSDFVLAGAARSRDVGEGGFYSPKKKPRPANFYNAGVLQMLAVNPPSSSKRLVLLSSPSYRWGRREANDGA